MTLSFEDAELIANNLGNAGPNHNDEPVMRFHPVGQWNGIELDFVVKVKDGENYERSQGSTNGMICGDENGDTIACDTDADFAKINMLRGHDATFIFEVQNAATHLPVVIPGFDFSLYDIDKGGNAKEYYRLRGYSTAQYDRDNTEAKFSKKENKCKNVLSGEGKCLYAEATHDGTGCGKCAGGI